jgi:inner membrane protein
MRRGHYWLRFMRLGRSDFALPHGIAFSHAVVALSIGTCFYRPEIPKRVWAACAVCSILPDIDVIGFRFGIHYGDFWAHRGFTHSLFIAALLSGAACAILPGAAWSNRTLHLVHVLVPRNCKSWCSGCHDRRRARSRVLDAMTDGGLGVAFFSPFDNRRYFLPWRPIVVSPISIARFFSGRGYAVLRSEVVWIWVPAFVFASMMLMLRHSERTEVATD